MITDVLEKMILQLLLKRRDNQYTVNQIKTALKFSNEDMPDIKDAVNTLYSNQFLRKEGNKYQIADLAIQKNTQTEKVKKEESALTNEILTGKFDATSLAKNFSFGFVIMEDGNDIMISSEDTSTAYHNDIVEVELLNRRGKNRYGIIRKVVERAKTKFVGTVEKLQGKNYFYCDSFKIHTPFVVNDIKEDLTGKKVILEVLQWGNKQLNQIPSGVICEVLGVSGLPEVELLSVIRDYELPMEFPEAVMTEVQAIEDKIEEDEIALRKDLRDLYTITIDPISAKDFDDAISLEELENNGLRLYVHIADVAHYIKPDSAIFDEVLNRGNSYYFPRKVIPMLPEKLSNKICSLRPEENKLTLTVTTDFDNQGNIIDQNIYETIICSNYRLSYEEVDLLFEGSKHPFDEEMVHLLNRMRKLSTYLSKNRVRLGYLKFDLPEVQYVFDDEGYLVDLKRSEETESHTLIENFMLIANEYVAKTLTKACKTTLYRIHEEPEETDLIKIKDILKAYKINFKIEPDLNKTWQNVLGCLPTEDYHRVFDRLVLRSMKKAKYSTSRISHFGLGIDYYTHFTSPIRRLCDLIVHLQLKKHVFHKSIQENEKNNLMSNCLFDYAHISTEKEAIADESERSMEFKTLLSFMKKKVGEEFEGIIISFKNSGMIVELDNYPVRGVVKYNTLSDDYYELNDRLKIVRGRRKGKVYRLADKVKVQINIVSEDIYFIILEQLKQEHPQIQNEENVEKKKKSRKFRSRKDKKSRFYK